MDESGGRGISFSLPCVSVCVCGKGKWEVPSAVQMQCILKNSKTHLHHTLGSLAALVKIIDGQQLLKSLTLGLAIGFLPQRIVLATQCQTPIALTTLLFVLAAAEIARIVDVLVPPAEATVVQCGKAARYVQRQVICATVMAKEVAVPGRRRVWQ